MPTIKRKQPTTGFLVAVMALVVALGGTAVAAQSGGDDGQRAAALTKKQVKKIAKKQANKVVTQRAPGLTVAKAALADNATKAALADAATNAVNAQNAANAAKVANLNVSKFVVSVADDAAPVIMLTAADATFVASCPGGIPVLEASGPGGGNLRATWIDNNNVVDTHGTTNLDASPTVILQNSNIGLGSGFVEYTSSAGQVVNIWYGFRDDVPDCKFFGNAMAG